MVCSCRYVISVGVIQLCITWFVVALTSNSCVSIAVILPTCYTKTQLLLACSFWSLSLHQYHIFAGVPICLLPGV